ncbi:DUF1549 domain-containing protein [Urbifossiella limnaea]|uniref:DUF1549 domain-containing protein n=1 Tax=Urbifossiella limnaea TaxID=2528023 RepID=A0A517XQI3_9BACT|nr:DUF1549 domain-containing protein [Urbifossiella limnaea]QDU19768.1 hypothetical protein ETAA1_17050 [Urbifossiella limnaea]
MKACLGWLTAGVLLGLPSHATGQDLLPPGRPISEVIDHYVDARLKQAGVNPAPPAADATLVRRLYLDLVGRIPAAVEARDLAGRTPDRRGLIESLASSPAFARHNANEFDVLLRNRNTDVPSLQPYLLDAFQENRPWDAMFRDLLGTSEQAPPGTPVKARADDFVLKRLKDADALTRDVSSVFFGLNITCAQCHRHPEIKGLTQDYFFGMKAFFAYSYEFQGKLLERQYVKVADFKAKSGEARQVSMMFLSGVKVELYNLPERELVAAVAEETKLIQEKSKEYAKTKALPPPPSQSARKRLAEVALDDTNRERFARSIVNRLWLRFYGHGLVMRVDQMHAENQPSHPELLSWLARDFVAHKYDLKRLITGLVGSRAYARSSEWKGTPPPKDLFAVAPTRPLTPAQWGMSYHIANQPEVFKPDDPVEVRRKKLAEVEKGGGVFPFIEQPFDDFQVGIDEPLRLSNDENMLKAMGGKLIPVLRKLPDTRRQIDEASWAVLSRPATDAEQELFGGYLERRKDRPDEGLRQVIWALFNSPEFRFNH